MNAKQVIAVTAFALLGSSAAFAQEAESDRWMNVDSTKSRAEVRADVLRADRALLAAGEVNVFPELAAESTRSRDEVRAEAATAVGDFNALNIGA
jgi:hypothetical protein